MYRQTGRGRFTAPYRPAQPVCDDPEDRFPHDDDCGCHKDKDRDFCEDDFRPEHFPIGMCYVPWQCFRDLYENEFAALENGILFKELDKDWYGRGCK